jgi:hypothetical protein
LQTLTKVCISCFKYWLIVCFAIALTPFRPALWKLLQNCNSILEVHIFRSLHATQLRRWKYHHSIQRNNISWFLMIVLIKDKHYSDLWPLMGQEVSYFNKLHICSKNVNNVSLKPYLSPGHNFGPFEHIFFVVVLFDSQSKTLFTVLFWGL